MQKLKPVKSQVWDQVMFPVVLDQVWYEVWDQVKNPVRDQVWVQVWSPLLEQLNAET